MIEDADEIAAALHEGIVPNRMYKPVVAAALLGITSRRAAKTLSDIPEELLPVHWQGPNGGLKRYYGLNILRYIEATGRVLPDLEEKAA